MKHRSEFTPRILLPLGFILSGGMAFSLPQDTIEFVPLDPFQTVEPAFTPRPVVDLLEAQIALSRRRFSCGSIDGVYGPQTQSALKAFQRSQYLRVHGDLDTPTRDALILTRPAFTTITITEEDLAALRPAPATWMEKSQVDLMGYTGILELVAERGQASPTLIRRLNPNLDWDAIKAGSEVVIPDAARPPEIRPASMILIHLGGKTLQAYDESGQILMHFPCSIAQRVEKRPVGQIEVKVLADNPNYTFDPAVFPESAEAREIKQKLIIPPGPNNPVGVAWIGLSLPGYGIHGTPEPEKVGRTESHGCFRLANWNAATLLKASWVGLPVYVEP